jgi:hypothetical protein
MKRKQKQTGAFGFFLFFIQRATHRRSRIEKDIVTKNGTRHAVATLNYFAHKNIQSNLQRTLTLWMHGIELMQIAYGIFASVFGSCTMKMLFYLISIVFCR